MTSIRRILPAGLTLLALTATPAGPARAASPKLDPDVLTGRSPRAIVLFDRDVTAGTIRRLSTAGITHAHVFEMIDAVGVLGPREAYAAIARWGDVVAVDDDSPLRFENFGAKKDTKVTQVRAKKAPLKRGYTGKGVTVAVVDTGIDSTHPDLADRVVKHVNFEPAWLFDNIQDGSYTDRIAEATGSPVDSVGHGTHVAGTVAGTGVSGQGEDFSGVAPDASLVDLQIAQAHEGLLYDAGFEMNCLLAYEWMLEHRKDPAFPGGIRVATNSWIILEADSEAEPITLMVRYAAHQGIVNVFGAGNAGSGEGSTVGVGPNRLEEVITVGAVCKTAGYEPTDTCAAGKTANFSSRGPEVDVVAPGVDIYSTSTVSVVAPIGGHSPPPGTAAPAAYANNAVRYTALSGTSMSTPHVAGIVALMLEANPRLSAPGVERLLIGTALDRGTKGFDNDYGFGLVDAHRAVAAAVGAVKVKVVGYPWDLAGRPAARAQRS